MCPPDCAPIITKDFDGWRVSMIRAGKTHTYVCETEREAQRFAELLNQPLSEPRRRPAPTSSNDSAGRFSLLRPFTRWGSNER